MKGPTNVPTACSSILIRNEVNGAQMRRPTTDPAGIHSKCYVTTMKGPSVTPYEVVTVAVGDRVLPHKIIFNILSTLFARKH